MVYFDTSFCLCVEHVLKVQLMLPLWGELCKLAVNRVFYISFRCQLGLLPNSDRLGILSVSESANRNTSNGKAVLL